jgi:hypothetical protein
MDKWEHFHSIGVDALHGVGIVLGAFQTFPVNVSRSWTEASCDVETVVRLNKLELMHLHRHYATVTLAGSLTAALELRASPSHAWIATFHNNIWDPPLQPITFSL